MVKKGSELEQVVALLESRINPCAKIETNVFLPDLSNPGFNRECDVVITEKNNKRTITTIVEVQDRGSRVSIGDYTNFYSKFRDVGANRLIIVSRQDFAKSITSKAKRHGPAVQLVNLSKLDAYSFEVGSVFYFYDLYGGKLDAVFSKDGFKFTDNQKKEIGNKVNQKKEILLYKGKTFSYITLFDILKGNYENYVEGIHDFEFVVRACEGLNIIINDGIFPIAIIFNGQMIVKKEFITDLSEYKPVDDNPLVYVSEALISVNGINEKITITYEWDDELGAYYLKSDSSQGLILKRIHAVKREDSNILQS